MKITENEMTEFGPMTKKEYIASDLKENKEVKVLKQLLIELEKKNSWGKNELKDLILYLLVD